MNIQHNPALRFSSMWIQQGGSANHPTCEVVLKPDNAYSASNGDVFLNGDKIANLHEVQNLTTSLRRNLSGLVAEDSSGQNADQLSILEGKQTFFDTKMRIFREMFQHDLIWAIEALPEGLLDKELAKTALKQGRQVNTQGLGYSLE